MRVGQYPPHPVHRMPPMSSHHTQTTPASSPQIMSTPARAKENPQPLGQGLKDWGIYLNLAD